jgi:hypothetical protein
VEEGRGRQTGGGESEGYGVGNGREIGEEARVLCSTCWSNALSPRSSVETVIDSSYFCLRSLERERKTGSMPWGGSGS